MQLLLRRFHWQKQTSGHLCEAVSTWVNFTGEDLSLSVNNASLQAGFLTGRETKSWVPEHRVHLSSCFPAMIHFAFKLWVRTKSSFLQVLFRYLVTETDKVALTNTCAYMHAYTHTKHLAQMMNMRTQDIHVICNVCRGMHILFCQMYPLYERAKLHS